MIRALSAAIGPDAIAAICRVDAQPASITLDRQTDMKADTINLLIKSFPFQQFNIGLRLFRNYWKEYITNKG